jgi:hypothetical protein
MSGLWDYSESENEDEASSEAEGEGGAQRRLGGPNGALHGQVRQANVGSAHQPANQEVVIADSDEDDCKERDPRPRHRKRKVPDKHQEYFGQHHASSKYARNGKPPEEPKVR